MPPAARLNPGRPWAIVLLAGLAAAALLAPGLVLLVAPLLLVLAAAVVRPGEEIIHRLRARTARRHSRRVGAEPRLAALPQRPRARQQRFVTPALAMRPPPSRVAVIA